MYTLNDCSLRSQRASKVPLSARRTSNFFSVLVGDQFAPPRVCNMLDSALWKVSQWRSKSLGHLHGTHMKRPRNLGDISDSRSRTRGNAIQTCDCLPDILVAHCHSSSRCLPSYSSSTSNYIHAPSVHEEKRSSP